MAKTIKQIADEIGVSKQAVFKKIDNLGCRQQLTKIDNQFTVDESLENAIKKAFSDKINTHKTVNQSSTKSSTDIQLVDDLVNVLKDQLKQKDLEIERLHQLLSQEQELHARLQNKIALLESPGNDNVVAKEESKKGFFARLFSGK